MAEPDKVVEVLNHKGRFNARAAVAAGLVTSSPDELDWDDEIRLAIEERASLSPDALIGMEASLRFAGPETMPSLANSGGDRIEPRGGTRASLELIPLAKCLQKDVLDEILCFIRVTAHAETQSVYLAAVTIQKSRDSGFGRLSHAHHHPIILDSLTRRVQSHDTE